MKPWLSLWAQEDFRDKFSNGQITWHNIALASNNDARTLRVIFDQDQDLSNSHARSISHVRVAHFAKNTALAVLFSHLRCSAIAGFMFSCNTSSLPAP